MASLAERGAPRWTLQKQCSAHNVSSRPRARSRDDIASRPAMWRVFFARDKTAAL